MDHKKAIVSSYRLSLTSGHAIFKKILFLYKNENLKLKGLIEVRFKLHPLGNRIGMCQGREGDIKKTGIC